VSAYADVEDPLAQLKKPEPRERPGAQTSEEMIKQAGWKLQAVNWVYEKVTGEDLIESLITPLLGDFEKIDQNAAAWDNVASALDAVRHNLNQGLKELDPHWEGEAAQKFERHISVLWTVAIEADSQLAKMISQRFENVASGCRKAVSIALFLLDKLIGKLMEAAIAAAIPAAGWARAVLLVKDAIDIVDSIRKIIIGIQQVIEGVQQMVEGVKAMGTALMKIKDVRSVNDAADVLDEFQEGQQTYQDGRSAATSGALGVAKGAWGLRGGIKSALGRNETGGGGGGSGGGSSSSGGSSGSGGGGGSGTGGR